MDKRRDTQAQAVEPPLGRSLPRKRSPHAAVGRTSSRHDSAFGGHTDRSVFPTPESLECRYGRVMSSPTRLARRSIQPRVRVPLRLARATYWPLSTMSGSGHLRCPSASARPTTCTSNSGSHHVVEGVDLAEGQWHGSSFVSGEREPLRQGRHHDRRSDRMQRRSGWPRSRRRTQT